MAYVYQHIRLDTNEVFYIGIGSDNSFKRAYHKKHRNRFWHNIVAKSQYTVEIIEKDISWENACSIEISLIAKFGRKDLGTGTLVNLTNGGDGANGCIRSEEHKKILSERMKGKKLSLGVKRSLETKQKISEGMKNAYLEKMYDFAFYAANH